MTWPGAGWRNRRAWGGEQLITSALCGNQVEGCSAAEQTQLHLRVLATQVITLCQQTPGACVVSKPPAHQPNHCTAPIFAESKLVSLFIFLGWSAVGLMRGRGWIQNSEGRSRLFQNVTKSKTWIWTDFDEEEKKTAHCSAQVDTGRVAKPQSRQMGIVITICKETVTTTSHQHHHSPNIHHNTLSALFVGDHHCLPLHADGIDQENTESLLPQNTFLDVDVLFPFLLLDQGTQGPKRWHG